MTRRPVVLAADIGGTKLSVARLERGRVLDTRDVPTPAREGPDAVSAALVELLGEWCTDAVALGVASAGRASNGRVTAISRTYLPGWHDYPLGEVLAERTGLPVTVLNDGQAAAWGEHRAGAGRGCSSLVFITVSTGIGGGLIVHGELVEGSTGLAGHLGHTSVDPGGPWCSCGRRGCIEQLASGTAIARDAASLLGRAVTARDVFAAARAGEPWAAGIIDASASHLAALLMNLRMLLDPDRILLGGGVGLADGYLDRVRTAFARLPGGDPGVLAPAALGREAGLVGAAARAAPSAMEE